MGNADRWVMMDRELNKSTFIMSKTVVQTAKVRGNP